MTVETSDAPTERRIAGLVIAGVTASLWSTIMGLALPGVIVVIAWMLTPHDPAAGGTALGGALRFAALVWVASHQVPLVSDGMTISLLPWLLIAWPTVVIVRATRRVASVVGASSLREVAAVAVTVGLTHAGWTVAVAALAGTSGLTVKLGQVVLHASVLAAVAGGAGLLVRPDQWRQVRDVLPAPVRLGLGLAMATAAALMTVATVTLAVLAVVRWSDLAAVTTALGGDLPGRIAVVLLSALFLGTAIGWASAWLVGSPIWLAGAPWGPEITTLGQASGLEPLPALPALPTLALLPERLPVWASYAPVLGWSLLAAGALTVVLRSRGWSVAHRVGAALVWVAGTSGVLTLLAALSSGAWGTAALSHIGPRPGDVALDVTVAAVALVSVMLGTPPLVRRLAEALRQRREGPVV